MSKVLGCPVDLVEPEGVENPNRLKRILESCELVYEA